MKTTLTYLALLLTSTLNCLAQGTTSKFYMDSSPSSYVGYNNNYGGGPLRIDSAEGYYWFSAFTTDGRSLHAAIGAGPYIWWMFDFDAPNNSGLIVGVTYENAKMWPFNGESPGLSFLGPGRGAHISSGSFTVKELSLNPANGAVNSVAVDFTMLEEKNSSLWNVGELRFNSSYPMTIPEPSSAVLLIAGGLITFFRLHRKK